MMMTTVCFLLNKTSLFQLLKDVAEVNFLADDCVEILDLDALLLHCVAVTDSYATVVERIVVDSDTEWCSDRILTTISLTDRILLIILAVEIVLEIVHDLSCKLWKTVLLDERKNCNLDWCERRRNAENHSALSVLKLLLLI